MSRHITVSKCIEQRSSSDMPDYGMCEVPGSNTTVISGAFMTKTATHKSRARAVVFSLDSAFYLPWDSKMRVCFRCE